MTPSNLLFARVVRVDDPEEAERVGGRGEGGGVEGGGGLHGAAGALVAGCAHAAHLPEPGDVGAAAAVEAVAGDGAAAALHLRPHHQPPHARPRSRGCCRGCSDSGNARVRRCTVRAA